MGKVTSVPGGNTKILNTKAENIYNADADDGVHRWSDRGSRHASTFCKTTAEPRLFTSARPMLVVEIIKLVGVSRLQKHIHNPMRPTTRDERSEYDVSKLGGLDTPEHSNIVVKGPDAPGNSRDSSQKDNPR